MLEWSAALPEVSCSPGTELIREGEAHGRLFVLLDGTVEVTRAGSTVAVIDEPGAVFGEMGALLRGPATATVRTVGPARLRRSDDPHGFLTAHPDVAYAVATMLARRLDTITGYLVDLRRQYADLGDNLGMVDAVLASLCEQQGARGELGSEREPETPC
jgi:CRP/FNR family transcriptional regulator, cyclic AMP receptor protein